MARLREFSLSSEDLDPGRCIMVDRFGQAMFMVMTDDGRWVPAEDY